MSIYNIEVKVDSAAKLAAVAGLPTNEHLFAPEINTIVDEIKGLRGSQISLKGVNHEVLILNGTPEANGVKFRAAYDALPDSNAPYSLMTLGGTIDYLPFLTSRKRISIGSLDVNNRLIVQQELNCYSILYCNFLNLTIPRINAYGILYCDFENFTGELIAAEDEFLYNDLKNCIGDISLALGSGNCNFEKFVGNISTTIDILDGQFNNCIINNIEARKLINLKFNDCKISNYNVAEIENSSFSNVEIDTLSSSVGISGCRFFNVKCTDNGFFVNSLDGSVFESSRITLLMSEFSKGNRFINSSFDNLTTVSDQGNFMYNTIVSNGISNWPNSRIVNCLDGQNLLINQ